MGNIGNQYLILSHNLMNNFFKNKINDFIIDKNNNINSTIMQKVLSILNQINDDKIDKVNSKILFLDNEINISIYPKYSNKNIIINLLVYNNVINLYFSESQQHFADDIFINNENDINEFEINFLNWLKYDIEENLLKINAKIKYFVYYKIINKYNKELIHSNVKIKNFNNFETRIYQKWID